VSGEAKNWWETHAGRYQKLCRLPVAVLYGVGAPSEAELQLIGPVAGKRVLEIGCGGAQCAVAFAQQGATVIAMDIAAAQIEFGRKVAREHGVNVAFHQRDIADLSPVVGASQDVVFSANAFAYVDDLPACFREVHRVLKPGGLFVWSDGHPFGHCLEEGTQRLARSYHATGKSVLGAETGCAFANHHRTIGDLFNLQVAAGFVVERMVEPDSRERRPDDPWFGLWDNTPERLALIPGTIIFKSRKLPAAASGCRL
jgi:2-polyprenyl-3-methyl-5-hydroxy-6-metoxy-1,4-benzoquinol methylase